MQNNIEIYVNRQKLDLGDDIDLNLSKSFEANSSIEFSYSFEIPSTYNNQCILGFANKLHVLGKFQHSYYAELYANGILIIQGSLYIDSATNISYSCNLIGNKELAAEDAINRVNLNSLGTTTKNGKKEDVYIDEIRLDTPDPNGKYYRWILKDPSKDLIWDNCLLLNKENDPVQYENLGIVEDCLIYPYALYGKPTNYLTGQGITPEDTSRLQESDDDFGHTDAEEYGLAAIQNSQQYMRPSFNVVDIIKTIFLNAGFTKFSGKFFTDPKFTQLYQTFQGNEKAYYDRDNQKFSFRVKKHFEGVTSTSKDYSLKHSTLRLVDSDIFEWKPRNYDEYEDERGINFLCTKLFQLPDLNFRGRNYTTTEIEYNGTDWNDPRLKAEKFDETNNSFNEILIKKAGWYNISTTMTYAYETSVWGSYSGINNNYQITSSNKVSGDSDVVNYENNVWEFQIVKHNSDPTLYSDVLNRSNQKFLEKSPYLTVDDVVDPTTYGRSSMITTRFNSIKTPGNSNNNHFADTLRIPKNNQTLFVNDDNFICGFRFGNQGYYPYTTTAPLNRHRMGLLLDLPYLDYKWNNGSLSENVYDESSKFLKLWSCASGGNVTPEYAGVGVGFSFYGPLERTAFNMLRADNSYTKNNTVIKPIGIDQNGKYQLQDELVNDFPYKDELGTRYWLWDNYCNNRYTSQVEIVNQISTYKIESSNLVWLDEGEYDARLISPVICTNPRRPGDEDYNELDTSYYPVAHNRIDYDIKFEYIGISDKEWKPTEDNVNSSVHSDKYTYFNQYLPHEKAIDWLENFQKTFNIEFKFNIDNDEVIADFNDKNNFTNSVDITKFVDFGNLSSSSSSFTEGGQPSSISIKMNNDEEGFGVSEESGSFSIYLGGTNDPEVVETDYGFSSMENIEVGNFRNPRLTIPTPVICTDTVWKASFPYTQTYEYSGSEKARLYYKGKVYYPNNNRFDDAFNWLFDRRNNKYMKFPVLSQYSPDGSINLQSPSTFMSAFWSFNSGSGYSGSGNEYIEVLAYLPLLVYNNIGKNTVIKLDDSYFKIDSIDSYNIIDTSCKIRLNLIG